MTVGIDLLGYGLALILVIMAAYLWRKAYSLQQILGHAAQRVQILTHEKQQLEKNQHELRASWEQQKEQLQKRNQLIDQLETRLQQQGEQQQNKIEQLNDKLHQSEIKIDHLQQQVLALSTQLEEANQEKRQLLTQNKALQASQSNATGEIKKRYEEQLSHLKKELDQSKSTIEKLQAELKRAEGKTEEHDIKQLKKRVQHLLHQSEQFNKLYLSMRGLRELAEERNKNWEQALAKLARWVLKKQNKTISYSGHQIGPLVAQALESINEQLVDDQFNTHGSSATRAHKKPTHLSSKSPSTPSSTL